MAVLLLARAREVRDRDGLETIDEWRAKGVDYTTETGAHYCFLTADDMSELGSVLRMNPPVVSFRPQRWLRV